MFSSLSSFMCDVLPRGTQVHNNSRRRQHEKKLDTLTLTHFPAWTSCSHSELRLFLSFYTFYSLFQFSSLQNRFLFAFSAFFI